MSDVSKTNEDLIAEARQCHQARGWSKDPLVDKLENLANRLADALEAATRVPVQGEPDACLDHKPVQHRDGKPPWCNECGLDVGGNALSERHEPGAPARDQLAKLIYEGHPDSMYRWDELDSRGKIWPLRAAGAILAAGFSRATVPDAATEAIDRVRAIHEPIPIYEGAESCGHADDEHTTFESDEGIVLCENSPLGYSICGGCSDDSSADGPVEHPCPTVAALDGAPEPEVKP